jgi:DNA-binding NarL/FixJ family response regulator
LPTVGAGVGVEFRDRCSSLGGEWAIASPQSPDTPGLRVLIVEANPEVREEIRSIVDRHPDVGLAWGAETVGDAVRTAALTHPDIVLVGAHSEGRLDLSSIGDVRAAYPAARVVLVSPLADPERRALAISHGADAFVANDDGGDRLRGELHARSDVA